MSDVPIQCPRCGFHPVPAVDICFMCADGIADADRTTRLIEASASLRDAARILDQVRDPRALPVLLEALAGDIAGRARRAVGSAGCDDRDAVTALLKELHSPDRDVVEAAVNALADTTVRTSAVNDGLADVMAHKDQPGLRAALALGWRRDVRALPVLEDQILTMWGAVGGNRFPEGALGRLGKPGREALSRLLSGVLSSHPDPPQNLWNEPDRAVRELLQGLLGYYGEPDADALAIAEQTVAPYPWARKRLAEIVALLRHQPPPDRPAPRPIDPASRVVPRWGMRFKRVERETPGPITRFGGQPFFPGPPTWPLHPTLGLPLTFFCQIATPSALAGHRPELAHVFIDVGIPPFEGDHYAYTTSEPAVILHPGGHWAGPTDSRRTGPTYAHDWPDPIKDRQRFRSGPQFGFVITEIDLVPGADPREWPRESFAWAADDFQKIGGTPLTLQGGEDQLLADGWRFIACFTPGLVGHEMGDSAECYVWVHPDGRGLLDVHSH